MNADWATSLLESHPDGIVVLDEHYGIVFANPYFCQLWGLDPVQARTMRSDERFTQQLQMLDNPAADALALRMVDTGFGPQKRAHFKLKNGRWLERSVFKHVVAGQKFGLVVQWRDVTDSYTELLAANHERDLMHAMMDSVPDQIFFKDLDSRFIVSAR